MTRGLSACSQLPRQFADAGRAVLWLAHAGPALDADFVRHAVVRFTPSEQARLGHIARPERRAQFIAGHLLARALLGNATYVPADAPYPAIEVAADGRPRPIDCNGWTLSLAHSGPWVAALAGPPAAQSAIGVDIEADRHAAPPDWPIGRRLPRAIGEGDLVGWVLSEACAKAGMGRDASGWWTRWQPSPHRGCWLAVAGMVLFPLTFLVNLAGGSYNRERVDLQWKQAQESGRRGYVGGAIA